MRVLFLCLFLLIPLKAISLSGPEIGGNNYCENLWSGMVSSVAEVVNLPPPPDEKAVLFAGPDGRLFNCLNQALPQGAREELQFWGRALSRAIASDPFSDNRRPPNYCGTSYGSVQGVQTITIHLPYDREELGAPTCAVRLRRFPERVQNFLVTE